LLAYLEEVYAYDNALGKAIFCFSRFA